MARFLGLGNGSDGAVNLSSYTLLKYSCSGTSGSYSLTATGSFVAGQRLFIHQSRGTGVGGYEDNQVASYTSGTITLVHPLERTYTDSGASQAQVLIVKEATSVTGSITGPAWNGDTGGIFVMACSGVFSGIVDLSARGYRGGIAFGDGDSGQYRPAQFGYRGEGTTGASSREVGSWNSSSIPASYYDTNGNGAGSAMTGFDGNHGQGGNGGSNGGYGTNGETYGGYVGSVGALAGNSSLTSMVFGGGGGGGADHGTDYHATDGGAGGGLIVVYSKEFSNTAQLTVNGGNGVNGPNNKDYQCGGGGAGGSILIKSVKTIIGSSKLSAIGGTGGQKNVSRNTGGNGGDGRIRIESCSLSGSSSPGASTSIGGHNYCGILTGMI